MVSEWTLPAPSLLTEKKTMNTETMVADVASGKVLSEMLKALTQSSALYKQLCLL